MHEEKSTFFYVSVAVLFVCAVRIFFYYYIFFLHNPRKKESIKYIPVNHLLVYKGIYIYSSELYSYIYCIAPICIHIILYCIYIYIYIVYYNTTTSYIFIVWSHYIVHRRNTKFWMFTRWPHLWTMNNIVYDACTMSTTYIDRTING